MFQQRQLPQIEFDPETARKQDQRSLLALCQELHINYNLVRSKCVYYGMQFNQLTGSKQGRQQLEQRDLIEKLNRQYANAIEELEELKSDNEELVALRLSLEKELAQLREEGAVRKAQLEQLVLAQSKTQVDEGRLKLLEDQAHQDKARLQQRESQNKTLRAKLKEAEDEVEKVWAQFSGKSKQLKALTEKYDKRRSEFKRLQEQFINLRHKYKLELASKGAVREENEEEVKSPEDSLRESEREVERDNQVRRLEMELSEKSMKLEDSAKVVERQEDQLQQLNQRIRILARENSTLLQANAEAAHEVERLGEELRQARRRTPGLKEQANLIAELRSGVEKFYRQFLSKSMEGIGAGEVSLFQRKLNAVIREARDREDQICDLLQEGL